MDAQTMKRRAGELAAGTWSQLHGRRRFTLDETEEVIAILRAVADATLVTDENPGHTWSRWAPWRSDAIGLVIEGRSDG